MLSFSLSFVLYVPNFATNLLSISRITRDLNYNVTSFSSSRVFQDLQMRMTIGSDRETNVYIFIFLAPTQGQLFVAYYTSLNLLKRLFGFGTVGLDISHFI